MVSQSIQILMVEDNPEDVELTKEAFNESKLSSYYMWSTMAKRRWTIFIKGGSSRTSIPPILFY